MLICGPPVKPASEGPEVGGERRKGHEFAVTPSIHPSTSHAPLPPSIPFPLFPYSIDIVCLLLLSLGPVLARLLRTRIAFYLLDIYNNGDVSFSLCCPSKWYGALSPPVPEFTPPFFTVLLPLVGQSTTHPGTNNRTPAPVSYALKEEWRR